MKFRDDPSNIAIKSSKLEIVSKVTYSKLWEKQATITEVQF